MLTNDTGGETAPKTCLNTYYQNSQISPFGSFMGDSPLTPSGNWLSQSCTNHRDLLAELFAD